MNTDDMQCAIIFRADTFNWLKQKLMYTDKSFGECMDTLHQSYIFNSEHELFSNLNYLSWELLDDISKGLSKKCEGKIGIYEVKHKSDEINFVAVFYRQKI